MFTQPPQTPVGGFVDSSGMVRGSRLRAAWLNYVAGQFPNALDAIIGGYYQFTGSIRLSSDTAQIKINAPAIGQPTKLLGFTTIGVSDDVNYATGTGALTVSVPATFSAGVTMSGALTFSNTVQFNGAVTVNAATTFTTNGDITLQSGCTLTGQSGSALTMDSGSTTTINGSATLAGTNTLNGTNTLSGTTTLSGITSVTNRRQLHRARVILADSNHTVAVDDGDRFELSTTLLAPRVITLESTSPAPLEGETLEFIWNNSGTTAGGTQYTFQRSDTTIIATFDGALSTDVGAVWAEFEFVGGVWRLGRSSGTPFDGTVQYGVVPGAGA